MVIQWLIGNYNPGTYGCFQSHGGTPMTIIHFWMDFPMEISHPAIKAYPHDYGNLHIMIYIYTYCTKWVPPVLSWCINHSNYRYIWYKPTVQQTSESRVPTRATRASCRDAKADVQSAAIVVPLEAGYSGYTHIWMCILGIGSVVYNGYMI